MNKVESSSAYRLGRWAAAQGLPKTIGPAWFSDESKVNKFLKGFAEQEALKKVRK